jgi:hypothetical protein
MRNRIQAEKKKEEPITKRLEEIDDHLEKSIERLRHLKRKSYDN